MKRHSTSPPCGNLVDGLPHDCHTQPRWTGLTIDPQRSVILVDILMFLKIFHIRSYWFVTFRPFILYWSLILCEYQLWRSMKPLFSTPGRARKNVEKMMKFLNFHEKSHRKFLDLEIYIWGAPHEGNSKSRLWMRWSALRVPGGNQVDGLPPARHNS